MSSLLKHGHRLSDYKLEINRGDLPHDIQDIVENICDDYVTKAPFDENGNCDVKKLISFINIYQSLKVDDIINIVGCINIVKFLKEENV